MLLAYLLLAIYLLCCLCAPALGGAEAARAAVLEGAGDREILSALTENLSANLLGLGNAATPAGIRAAQGMARQSGGRASDELCRLVVLNSASLQLLPSTVAAVRASAGAVSAFDILPAVWLSSLCSVAAGLLAAALLRRLWP